MGVLGAGVEGEQPVQVRENHPAQVPRPLRLTQVIQAGQPLLAVVFISDLWVTANYKETQLKKMKIGDKAEIEVDAYGSKLRGHIDSVGGATGARFSLLPPENATGNYVKVVQRLPVKIVFDSGQDAEVKRLRPGMSVTVTVMLGSK